MTRYGKSPNTSNPSSKQTKLKNTLFLFRQIILLIRVKLSASVAFSTLAAYFLATETVTLKPLLLFLGVFALAGGASALNQIQERKYDALMLRTHKRPIPNGTLSLNSAALTAFVFLISGVVILFFAGSFTSMLLGVFSLLWYNLLYTSLKRITAFAMVPGTLTGVIPVVIGWEAAGGSLQNKSFLLVCSFMALWQLPHFMLLMLRYKDDYQRAGFPALTDIFTVKTVKNLIFIGVIGLLVVCSVMIASDVFRSMVAKTMAAVFSAAFVIVFAKDLYKSGSNYRWAFISINIYMLIIMVLLLTNLYFFKHI